MKFDIAIVDSVSKINPKAWDSLSAGRPFTSHHWYAFGERVMADWKPFYIILSTNEKQIARGTFWLTVNEEIPIASQSVRRLIEWLLSKRPLLVCRSPLLSVDGLILPESELRQAALQKISAIALEEMHHQHGSFLLFSFLRNDERCFAGWPANSSGMILSDPGTRMELQWENFEDYLKQNKHRMHQHYRRTKRESDSLGIQITEHGKVSNPDEALELIHNVENRHNSQGYPFSRALLENIQMIDSTWLEARIGNRLVGCMTLLVDNRAQYAFLPGLTYESPCIYNMLLYKAMQSAFDKKLSVLLWGNMAYETKRRLGFGLEDNNNIVFQSDGALFGLIARIARKVMS